MLFWGVNALCGWIRADRLPAIDLPVADAMNEKPHERSMHRSRILD
jgi:hypothetical protein